MSQPYQPPVKDPRLTDEEWEIQLEEMKAYAKRVWRQSKGQVDVYPYPDCPPKPNQ
jgi:hypothetical protein